MFHGVQMIGRASPPFSLLGLASRLINQLRNFCWPCVCSNRSTDQVVLQSSVRSDARVGLSRVGCRVFRWRVTLPLSVDFGSYGSFG